MAFKKVFGWLGFAALFTPVFASCAHSPEGFCQGWVQSSCEALKGCCPSGLDFDPEGCQLTLSATCQNGLDVEQIHSGEFVFDSGAASNCFVDIQSCSDVVAKQTYENQKACGNAVTGFRPTGAECSNSKQCAKAGDFPVCFNGALGNGNGICAKAVLADDGKCGFSLSTNELRFCPDGRYCDISGVTPDTSKPPTERALEFSAPCKSYAQSGDACGGNPPVPCDSGLYCDFGGGSICAKTKGEGSSCNGSDECSAGLSCQFQGGGMNQVCTKGSAAYCYKPN